MCISVGMLNIQDSRMYAESTNSWGILKIEKSKCFCLPNTIWNHFDHHWPTNMVLYFYWRVCIQRYVVIYVFSSPDPDYTIHKKSIYNFYWHEECKLYSGVKCQASRCSDQKWEIPQCIPNQQITVRY